MHGGRRGEGPSKYHILFPPKLRTKKICIALSVIYHMALLAAHAFCDPGLFDFR